MLSIGVLREGIFLRRTNRFVCECAIDGEQTFAHLPNSGKLMELLTENRKVYLVKNDKGKLPFKIRFVEKDGLKILVDTVLTNQLVCHLVERDLIPSLVGYRVLKKEVPVNRRRIDFILEKDGRKLCLEVKNSTLFRTVLSMFPDCQTERGRSHIKELLKLKNGDTDAGILFVVSSPTVKYFLPDFHNDFHFARELFLASEKIWIGAISFGFGEDLSISEVKELSIPWHELIKVKKDSGVYLLGLKIEKDVDLQIGALGQVSIRSGYYVYSGSAKMCLKKRIERHGRKKKKVFWHIDYLTSKFRPYFHLPVRIDKPYECYIARRLAAMCDWIIPNFGSSDCKCLSHLFGFEKDPLKNERFIDFVLYLRLGLIEERLEMIEKEHFL